MPSQAGTVVFIAASCAGASSLPPSSARQKWAMSAAVLTRLPARPHARRVEHGDVAQLAVDERVAAAWRPADRGALTGNDVSRRCSGAKMRRSSSSPRQWPVTRSIIMPGQHVVRVRVGPAGARREVRLLVGDERDELARRPRAGHVALEQLGVDGVLVVRDAAREVEQLAHGHVVAVGEDAGQPALDGVARATACPRRRAAARRSRRTTWSCCRRGSGRSGGAAPRVGDAARARDRGRR